MSSGENERLAGRYRVVRRLGRGGMGVVWRAVDEVLGREVAVKELRTYNDSSGPELADLHLRMQREARAAARVRHPGVIAVHDVTEHQGRPVIVMELVDGPSLDDVLSERGVLDPREAAAIGAAVLEALAAAHDVGVLHRDVKPGNVLLDRSGRVVLTDFGIAAMDDPGDGSTTRLTRSGEIVGSLDYLAPERAQGQQPGPASDVWALGATLYAAVEGSSPFRRTSTWSTLNAIVVEPLPEPRRAGALAPVLQQLMDKDPARRPDARSAARLLTAVAQGQDATATAATPATGVMGATPYAGPGPVPVPVPTERNAMPHQPEGFGPAGFGPASLHQGDGFGHGSPQAPHPVAPPAAAIPEAGRSGAGKASERKRSTALVAAAVASVLLVGGGVTYALVERDGGSEEKQLAGGQASPTAAESPGRAIDPGSVGSTASASASASATPSKDGTTKPASPSPSAATKAPVPGSGSGGTTAGGGTTGGGTTGSTTSGGSGTSGSSTTTGGAGSPTQPAPVCHPTGGGTYDCQVWRTEKTYSRSGAQMGILNAGTNYFYCQADLGRRETSGEWTNVWWARTDDDSGNTDVYFSVVYIKGGDNDQPVPGLPVC
ncbi:serine/threonine protein kinase [Streptomyces sp. ISL-36]|uniref:serine/threonine-protein kinase n=1 Tax=Streptomyces sp. ISL-36 TaxID=2819182 RepID=UPI001BE9F28B|nr:serine/threonine-protein kinase [Streptomyces sp. ISL-36]MBT2442042.1 serine/threonine protein kinase [Streptomyces sp. ISL-36]